jgi:hypothetical protein
VHCIKENEHINEHQSMKKSEHELQTLRDKYPSVPEFALPKTRTKKKTATGELTHEIITYVQSLGAQCYRVNSQGQFDPRTNRWRKSGMKAGLPDLHIIYKGRFIGCELKASKGDKLSEVQQSRKQEIVDSGASFIVARSLNQFKEDFNSIINNLNK